jgi:hypothetical protein
VEARANEGDSNSTDFAKAVNTVNAAIGANPALQSSQVMHEFFNSPLRPWLRLFPKTHTKKRKLDDLPCDSSKSQLLLLHTVDITTER